MKSGRFLIVIGALVLAAPYIGLPYSMLAVLLPALGILVIVSGARLLRESRARTSPHDQGA